MKATRIELQKDRVVQRRELLKKFAKAWGKRDIDAVMACMTSNCVYEASVGPEPGTTFQGADQVRRGILQMFAHDEGVQLEFPIYSYLAITPRGSGHTLGLNLLGGIVRCAAAMCLSFPGRKSAARVAFAKPPSEHLRSRITKEFVEAS